MVFVNKAVREQGLVHDANPVLDDVAAGSLFQFSQASGDLAPNEFGVDINILCQLISVVTVTEGF